MKVLQSNKCIHDCGYCVNSGSCTKKMELQPKEIAQTFGSLRRKGIVQGLFLSSAVTKNADETADKMIESAKLVRKNVRPGFYLHLKVLPAMSREKIREMAEYADRLSLNIEAPSKNLFSELGSTKDYFHDLEKRIDWISDARGKYRMRSFTTQFILGAAQETDFDVLKKMNSLYKETDLWRTYFSAFEPVKGIRLEDSKAEKPAREHRLYQSDWLMRVYNFEFKELKLALNEEKKLSLQADPKMTIAVNSPNKFPIDPNNSTRDELLHVPGIGPSTAERISHAVESGKKFRDFKELKQYGLIMKRAESFLQLDGERQARLNEFCF